MKIRKGLLFLVMLLALAALTSGCITAVTPSNKSVVVVVAGKTQAFTVTATSATSWHLDDVQVATGKTYIYAPTDADAGDHVLTVKETGSSISSKTWNIRVIAPIASYLQYNFPDQLAYKNGGGTLEGEHTALFSGYTLTDNILYSPGPPPVYVSGYALDQFVEMEDVNDTTPDPDLKLGANDGRALYSIVTRSNLDGFSNRTDFLRLDSDNLYTPDLRWDQFIQGYLLRIDYLGRSFYPASVAGAIGKHRTKWAYDIYMFRKIDVKRPDAAGSLATFEPQATTDSYVNDTAYHSVWGRWTTKFSIVTKSFGAYTNARVIPLTQFLTDYVTNVPGNYTYKIVALDGTYKNGWTYAKMQQAYYLVDYDFIVQVDSSNKVVSGTKLNFPVRIEVISGSPVEYNYSAKNPPAYAKAYEEDPW
jgi:hypothetical protein